MRSHPPRTSVIPVTSRQPRYAQQRLDLCARELRLRGIPVVDEGGYHPSMQPSADGGDNRWVVRYTMIILLPDEAGMRGGGDVRLDLGMRPESAHLTPQLTDEVLLRIASTAPFDPPMRDPDAWVLPYRVLAVPDYDGAAGGGGGGAVLVVAEGPLVVVRERDECPVVQGGGHSPDWEPVQVEVTAKGKGEVKGEGSGIGAAVPYEPGTTYHAGDVVSAGGRMWRATCDTSNSPLAAPSVDSADSTDSDSADSAAPEAAGTPSTDGVPSATS